jgi:hypothetical protein
MRSILSVIFFLLPFFSFAQTEIFIDSLGAMRWQKGQQKAYFFGINYTAPFAYGYRSIKRNGSTIEQAIDNDVYHFARIIVISCSCLGY